MAEDQKQEQPDATGVPDRTAADVAKAQEKQERKDRRQTTDEVEDGIQVERLLARSHAFTGFSRAAVEGGLALSGKGSRKNVTVDEAREAAEAFRSREVQYEN